VDEIEDVLDLALIDDFNIEAEDESPKQTRSRIGLAPIYSDLASMAQCLVIKRAGYTDTHCTVAIDTWE
jgi:NAD(P)H-nitrite reductase large subunit